MWSNDSGTAATRYDGLVGWRGIVLVACTYIYFLIFAQFGFLKRLAELHVGGDSLKAVMAAMAAGGILASLLTPRIPVRVIPARRVRLAFFGCATAALLTLTPLNWISGVGVSFLIGVSLGALTVSLVTDLNIWIGSKNSLLKVGLGTGLGYLACNLPPVFTASPKNLAIVAAIACFAGITVASGDINEGPRLSGNVEEETESVPAFGLLLTWFTALVWLDSAAFFIIQNSPGLKSGTWGTPGQLWRNGFLHLSAAIVGGWLLKKRGTTATLTIAFALLGGACLLLLNPRLAPAASIFYPVGVSLYSVALVAYPSYLMPSAFAVDRGRRAGWIYAVAGWIGSAMGIGMGQNLHRVPPAFVSSAALLFLAPWMWRFGRRYLLQGFAVAFVLGSAFVIHHFQKKPDLVSGRNPSDALVERGHQVYISEGCINCHSQYVRPNSPDILMWGPASDLEAVRREQPPLIGNRRQGPDLSEVGSRRSPLWLRIHFMNPREVSYDSIMPQYAYLFQDDRGDALIAYIESLQSPQSAEHFRRAIAEWKPTTHPNNGSGKDLFADYCATCHSLEGKARIKWRSAFKRLPPDLATDKLLHVPENESLDAQQMRIAQIIKFGLPGTDMPGHEYLPDTEVEAIAAWVRELRTSERR